MRRPPITLRSMILFTAAAAALRSGHALAALRRSRGPLRGSVRLFASVTDITSVKNPEVLAAKKLLRSKRERERSGIVAVEGIRLIGDVMDAGHEPRSVFFCPRMMITEEAESVLDSILALEDCEARRVTPQVMNSMCDTVTPQGLLALFDRPTEGDAAQGAPAAAGEIVLLLSEISDPGNMGTLVRSSLALGCSAVLVYGKQSVDPLGPKALRASMGSAFRLPIVQCTSLAEVETYLRQRRGWQAGAFFAADASHAEAQPYFDVDWSQGNTVIAIGSEATGLADEIHGRLDGGAGGQAALEDFAIRPIKVPMAPEAESLNAGVAGSIILAEVQRQRARE